MAKKKAARKKAPAKKKTVRKKAAKKATRKKAPKKRAAKKATKKTSTTNTRTVHHAHHDAARSAALAMKDIIARARDHFRIAPAEHVFVLADGQSVKDLRELAESFDGMEQHIFDHHVNDARHDFANWVHAILHERALAEQMRRAERNPHAHQNVIFRHIVRRVW